MWLIRLAYTVEEHKTHNSILITLATKIVGKYSTKFMRKCSRAIAVMSASSARGIIESRARKYYATERDVSTVSFSII